MSSRLRRISATRLTIALITALAAAIAGTAIAVAVGSGPRPQPKPLAQAVHDALQAPPPAGVTARVQLVSRLFEGASLASGAGSGGSGGGGSNPLLTGAEGRLWISSGGQIRLELQSESGATQLLYDGSTLNVYDSSANTLYSYTPPAAPSGEGEGKEGSQQVPSVAAIQREIERLMGHADISGAIPTDVAGHAAYAVKISPKDHGGLLGGAELAWDATHGVPLRLALYAKGDPSPVLELTATEVSYGPVPGSIFSLQLPEGVKKTTIKPPAGGSQSKGANAETVGLSAVQAAVPFKLQAPAQLAGMQRRQVRLIEVNGGQAALICYGEGLGGIAVIEAEAKPEGGGGSNSGPSSGSSLPLPSVPIDGTQATELPTALGTALRYRSGGIDHILAGSVTPSVIEAAARGL